MAEHERSVSSAERRIRGWRLARTLLFYLSVLSLWALTLVCPACRLCGDGESFMRRASAFYVHVGMLTVLSQLLVDRPSIRALQAARIALAVVAIDFAAFFAAAACRGGRSMRLLCAVGVGVGIPVAVRVLLRGGRVGVRAEAAVGVLLATWFGTFGEFAVVGGAVGPRAASIAPAAAALEIAVEAIRELCAGASEREMDVGGKRELLVDGQDER